MLWLNYFCHNWRFAISAMTAPKNIAAYCHVDFTYSKGHNIWTIRLEMTANSIFRPSLSFLFIFFTFFFHIFTTDFTYYFSVIVFIGLIMFLHLTFIIVQKCCVTFKTILRKINSLNREVLKIQRSDFMRYALYIASCPQFYHKFFLNWQ